MVQLFSLLRSIQNLRFPSFWIRTTTLAHGLCDFQMAQISNISCRWAYMSSYMWGLFAGNVLWRASGQSAQPGVWWGMSFLGQGHCRLTAIPIWPAASWPSLVPPQATPLCPGGSAPSVFPGITGRLSQGFFWEDHQWHLVGWSNLTNDYFGGDYYGVGI